MNEMRDVELLVILGFYYIGKERNAEHFTALFNSYFNKDISKQTLLYEVSKFRNVDPFNNVSVSGKNARYQKMWKEYIGRDKVDNLKTLYKSFKDGEFISYFEKNEKNQVITINSLQDRVLVDEAKEVDNTVGNVLSGCNRNRAAVENALFAAGYKCEGDCETKLFVRKDGTTNYTEAHHLIPLKFQPNFGHSLDVEANIVSLCPMCHRALHYGLNNSELLKVLHERRAERLKKCLIYISYEKLLLLYAGDSISEDEL